MHAMFLLATLINLATSNASAAVQPAEAAVLDNAALSDNVAFWDNPQGEIFELAYFAGHWDCQGTAWDLKSGVSQAVRGTWDFAWDCTHQVLTDQFSATIDGNNYTAWGWQHYDSQAKSWVRDATDSSGTWSSVAAGGASDVTVWRGGMKTVAYGAYELWHSITRKASTVFWSNVIIRPAGHERWFDAFKGTCRRLPPRGR